MDIIISVKHKSDKDYRTSKAVIYVTDDDEGRFYIEMEGFSIGIDIPDLFKLIQRAVVEG